MNTNNPLTDAPDQLQVTQSDVADNTDVAESSPKPQMGDNPADDNQAGEDSAVNTPSITADSAVNSDNATAQAEKPKRNRSPSTKKPTIFEKIAQKKEMLAKQLKDAEESQRDIEELEQELEREATQAYAFVGKQFTVLMQGQHKFDPIVEAVFNAIDNLPKDKKKEITPVMADNLAQMKSEWEEAIAN